MNMWQFFDNHSFLAFAAILGFVGIGFFLILMIEGVVVNICKTAAHIAELREKNNNSVEVEETQSKSLNK